MGGELAHGLMEAQAQDLRAEVDRVTLQIAFGPAPVNSLDDEARVGAQLEVAAACFEEREAAFFEQREQWREACGADLLACPDCAAEKASCLNS